MIPADSSWPGQPGRAVKLRSGSEHIHHARTGAAPSGFQALDGVVRDVARPHLLSRRLGIVEHFGGDGGSILDQFLGIFRADAADGTGNCRMQTGRHLFLQYQTCLWSDRDLSV